MELFYWKSTNGNVGDDLNAWLWPKVLGDDVFSSDVSCRFLGIGSVLTPSNLLSAPGKNVIFGPGLRSADTAAAVREYPLDLRFVRGPRSAAALGGVPYISDPAVLSSLYYERREPVSGRIGFVPYMKTPAALSRRICEEAGLVCIPVTLDVESFFAALTECEYVICEAMHGAILADAFRVPWAGCRISSALNEGPTSFFKWDDWQESLGLDVPLHSSLPDLAYALPRRIRRLAKSWVQGAAPSLLKSILKKDQWALSDAEALENAQRRILSEVGRLRAERCSSERQEA